MHNLPGELGLVHIGQTSLAASKWSTKTGVVNFDLKHLSCGVAFSQVNRIVPGFQTYRLILRVTGKQAKRSGHTTNQGDIGRLAIQ